MPILGVKVRSLQVIPDERGRLFEVLRADDPEWFQKFGQAYITTTYPGVVKAWHLHRHQEDYFTCLRGMIKLVIHDLREDSPTRGQTDEIFMGEHQMSLVVVPRGTWHGWKSIAEHEAMILNLVTEPYNHQAPDEERLPPHDNGLIPYDWSRRDG